MKACTSQTGMTCVVHRAQAYWQHENELHQQGQGLNAQWLACTVSNQVQRSLLQRHSPMTARRHPKRPQRHSKQSHQHLHSAIAKN